MTKRSFSALLVSFACVGAAVFAAACGKDSAPSDNGGTGGASPGTGGTSPGTGGRVVNTGGRPAGTGGASGTSGASGGGTAGADASAGGTPGSGGTDGGPTGTGGTGGSSDCFTNPTTHFEIINACTNAEKVDKTPSLPLLLSDGGLPALP